MDVRLPDGRILRGVPDGTTKAQLAEKLQSNGIDVPKEWLGAPAPPPDPAPDLGAMNSMPLLNRFRSGLGQAADFADKELTPAKAAAGVGEGALAMGSGMAAAPAAGLAGLAMNSFSPLHAGAKLLQKAGVIQDVPDSADVVRSTQNALTYEPRTEAGKLVTKAASYPFEKLAEGADTVGGAVTDKTGSPALGAFANTAIQAIPLLLARRGAAAEGADAVRAPRAADTIERIAGDTPRDRAQNYVNSRTTLAWDRLSADLQRRLKEVAATGNNLERLDPTALERQALLTSLDRPINNATRGQLTRDPLQQRAEQLLKATDTGAELKVRDLEQNQALLGNLDILRGHTGGTAVGDIQTGQSVQGALRERRDAALKNVSDLYDQARDAGEMQGKVAIDPLIDYLQKSASPKEVAFAKRMVRQFGGVKTERTGGIEVTQTQPLTLEQLDSIYKEAGAQQKAGGTAAYKAGEIKGIINDLTEGAGGEKYKAARAARRAVGDEFERQNAVARLVEEKNMSRDRATALEDTWHQTVMAGSLDDLRAVRKSLAETPRGAGAWADLKAATIDYIKNKATGGRLGLKNETGDLNAQWGSMKRAVEEIGPDKLKELFGDDGAKKIETIVEAVQILKTEAPMGVKGSPTIDKLLTVFDKLGKVPVVGGSIGKTVEAVQTIKKLGQPARELKRATSTPLDDATRAP